jgi:hypothetical protein
MATVVEAISQGQITPGEGEILASILAEQTKVVTTAEVERRVEEIEKSIQTRQEG